MEKEFRVLKYPECENDSAFVSLDSDYISVIRESIKDDDYYLVKNRKFLEKNLDGIDFEPFAHSRPSLRNMSNFLEGSIYTYTCEKKNGMCYEAILDNVRTMISKNSRRAFITISDRFLDYRNSEIIKGIDVSCLSGIHYTKDKITLFFRASDIKNELLIDIVTVYDYFIREIYGNRNVKIELMISTCQNYKNLKEYEDKQN